MHPVLQNHKRLAEITGRSPARIHITLILVVALVAYANSFAVPMQFDDYRTLSAAYANASRGWGSLFAPGASRWFVDVTFALDRFLHGYWMGGYHLVNLAIHVGAALVVYGLLGLMLAACPGTSASPEESSLTGRFIPLVTALLFVSHPIQTEAVTYISQRYSSLAALLYLVALYCYFRARQAMCASSAAPLPMGGMKWWLAFTLSAILAMKCKQISITLPVMVAICEGVFYRGHLFRKVTFVLLLTALLAVVPIQEIASTPGGPGGSFANMVRQASSENEVMSRSSYFLTQQRVEITYLRLLLLPVNQNLDYDYPVYSSLTAWPAALSLLANLFLMAVAIWALIRSRRSSGGQATLTALQLAGLGIVWFYVTLAVESSVIPISDIIFEHRLYLPSVGFFMTITAGLGMVAEWRPGSWRLVWSITAVVVVVLTTATIMRNKVWGSDLALWTDVVEKSPNKARSRYFIGTLYLKRNMLDQAIASFVRAIELNPSRDLQRISLNHAIASHFPEFEHRSSTGGTYQSEFETVKPAYYQLWLAVSFNNLGLAYEMLNKPDRAKYNYTLAIIRNPDLDIAWYNLALLAARQHDAEGYQRAVGKLEQLNPKLLRQLKSRVPEGRP